MGKKGKVGKARKDRFYHLAKETGYRSRAAFKLIQLNRKFEFLQKSNVIVDLCAAPGGWLQVAAENAPMSNHIIGIDLVPIPPIKNVTTLEEDITTEKCRQALKKELLTAKADLFLNDGAPNVGTNWLNDAYQQVELTLYALKLATEFLRKGGWFVTKIFRSKDYDSLMWVFQQLFKNVHATKPQASRNESAEIFVVCQSFIAPDKIDPKFLNPKFVFKEVSEEKKLAIDLVHPSKRHRHREGYPEGDQTLFSSLSVTKFIASPDFMNLLAQSSEIKFDSEEIESHPLTTTEIKECLKDIKILGKSEIKNIFKWRTKLKKALEESNTIPTVNEVTENETQEAEEVEDELDAEEKEIAKLDQLLEEKNLQELKEMKKAKKKVRKAQMKQKARIDAKMVIPGDRLDVDEDLNMFDIKGIKNKEQLSEVEGGDLSVMDGDDMFDEDSDEDALPKPKRTTFERGEKKFFGAGVDSDSEEEMEEEPTFNDVDDDEEDEDDEKERNTNPLLVDMGVKQKLMKENEDSWFSKSVFDDLDREADEDIELGQMGMEITRKKRREKAEKEQSSIDLNLAKINSDEELSDSDDSDYNDKVDEDDSGVDSKGQDESDDDDDDDSEDDSDYDYMEANDLKKKKTEDASESKVTKFDGIEVVPVTPDPRLQLNEEGLAIGAAMMQSRKRKREIIESGYHRYMYDDMGLPDWFEKEEKKHTQRQMPISKAELEEYRMKSKAIDAAPIKKIAEAKARKKKRMLKSLEKARKKANAISDNVDVSEKEKWNQIKHVYKKAGLLKKAKEKVTYVKAKKGAGKKVRRPTGVKGKFKVVDGRLKKDVKSQQKAEMRKQKNSTKRKKQHAAKANRRVRR